jgi:hypothetical protein
MLDFFPTRRTVRVSVVPVGMTAFWIGWFVIGQLQKQAQQQSNGKGNCELRTAKADPPPSAKDDNKKTTQ